MRQRPGARPRGLRGLAAVGAAAVLLFGAAARAGEIPAGGPYVPTPQVVVEEMLELAKVGPRDFVIDLGSGDGRIVLTAATKFRARGLGVDLDAQLVAQANEAARDLGVADRVRFRQQDALETDVRRATVVTLYLLPGLMQELRPKLLKQLAPGARIVSHDFDFGDWEPDKKIEVRTPEKYGSAGDWVSTVLLWIVPAAVEGRWTGEGGELRLELKQRYQRFTGTLVRGGERLRVRGGRIEGVNIRFTAVRADGSGREFYTGTVRDSRIDGEVRTEADAPVGRWSVKRAR